MESYVDGVSAIFWIKVPLANQFTLKMYYGNASVSSMSDGDSTFVLFDHFEGSTLNTTKWVKSYYGTATVDSSEVTIDTTNYFGVITKDVVSASDWIAIEARMNCTNPCDVRFVLVNRSTSGDLSSWYHNAVRITGGNSYASSYNSNVLIGAIDTSYHRFKLLAKQDSAGTGYVDGVPATCGVALTASAVYLHLANMPSTSTAVVDWVFIRQAELTEPTLIPCTIIEYDLRYIILGEPDYSGWARDTIAIAHEVTIPEYQHKVDLTWHIGINSDFSDIRFTQVNTAPCYHYIDPDSLVDGVSCTVWVRVPAAYQTHLYMYHCGDPAVTTTSNGNATFEFIDDFEGVALDTSKWTYTVTNGGTCTVADGRLSLTTPAFSAATVCQNSDPLPSTYPIIVESYANLTQDRDVDYSYSVLGLPSDAVFPFYYELYVTKGAAFGSSGTGMDYRWYDGSMDFNPGYFDSTTYNTFKMVSLGTGNTTAEYYVNGVLQTTHTVTFHPYIAIGAFGNGLGTSAVWVDWVRVRKYVATEPTLAVTAIQGFVQEDLTYSIKAPVTKTKPLEYVVSSIPVWTISKSLKYTIPTTLTVTKTLEYIAIHRIVSQETLTYSVQSVHSVTKGLQYIVPHLEIAAIPPVTGRVPINIGFVVTSQSNIGTDWTWTWDFDGDSGSTTTPATTSCTHQFLGYGEYDVVCTAATIVANAQATTHISLIVDPKPVAIFYMDKTTGVFPLTVTFYNYSSGAVSYDWDFGDGTIHSNATNPVHMYTISNDYTVTLTAINGNGDSIYVDYVTSDYVTPIADFEVTGIPTQVSTREVTVTLDIEDRAGTTSSVSKDVIISPGPFTVFKDLSTGSIKHWEWNFGDEHGPIRSKLQHPSHMYDRYNWTWITDSASCGSRLAPGLVQTSTGVIVLIGGGGSTDTWISYNNGDSWTRQSINAGWHSNGYGLYEQAVILSDDTIVISCEASIWLPYDQAVWKSTDLGINWTQLTASPGYPPRFFHSVVRLSNDHIILMGGYGNWYGFDPNYNYNDVWRSTDGGTTWAQMTASAGWDGRRFFNAVVLSDDSIVVTSGLHGHGVWISTDEGANWTEQTDTPGYSTGYGAMATVLLNDDIILMGGDQGSADYVDDVWRSVDAGENWTLENASPGWVARWLAASVRVSNGDVLLIGGQSWSGVLSDVWKWIL
jgi:PKD repeat protein